MTTPSELAPALAARVEGALRRLAAAGGPALPDPLAPLEKDPLAPFQAFASVWTDGDYRLNATREGPNPLPTLWLSAEASGYRAVADLESRGGRRYTLTFEFRPGPGGLELELLELDLD